MCGIAGFVGGFSPGLIDRMNAAQRHRGPDGQGTFEDPAAEVALGHVRLAILDLTPSAAQPMHSPDGRFVLVYNGEIYNFAALRDHLIQAGHTFTSTGDTEVLLRGLQHEGAAFIKRLDGIFAFALWDRRERTLLLARDQLAVKPLYYAEPSPGTLLFASEIKALLAFAGLRREPDFEVLQQHMAFCHASGDRTALQGVRRLGPGSTLLWHAGTMSTSRFWTSGFGTDGGHASGFGGQMPVSRQHAVADLRDAMRRATVAQMVSDVPVGVALSGGIDSTLITTLAAQGASSRFQCYSVVYGASENVLDNYADDAPFARTVAQSLGLPLTEIPLAADIVSLWPQLVYQLDEPIVDPAAICAYLISKRAAEDGVKVLLSGQGADELFGGYPRYQATQMLRGVDRVPRTIRRCVAAVARRLPASTEGRWGAQMRRGRRVLLALPEDSDGRFLSYCAHTPQDEISRVLSPGFRESLGGRGFQAACRQHMRDRSLRGVERFLDRDLSIYLPNHNLHYTDRMGMAAGVEVRVPLLDLELVERVVRYPTSWKIQGSTTKVLLREACRGVIPDKIIDRAKGGFTPPYRKWMRYDMQEMWNDLMSESAIRRRGWFDPPAVADARRRSQSGQADLYMLQWALLTIELWARRYIDGAAGERMEVGT